MEKSITLLFLLLFSICGWAQEENKDEFTWENDGKTFTMKKYVFCLYLSGSNRSQSDEEAQKIQSAHLKHLGELAEKNGLMIAGPFDDDTEKRGMLIFNLRTVEEAEALVKEDPAVKAGRLNYECHPWWGAKGSVLD